eukprot:358810-Chlamydomonas_euryale.AAC.9
MSDVALPVFDPPAGDMTLPAEDEDCEDVEELLLQPQPQIPPPQPQMLPAQPLPLLRPPSTATDVLTAYATAVWERMYSRGALRHASRAAAAMGAPTTLTVNVAMLGTTLPHCLAIARPGAARAAVVAQTIHTACVHT